MVNRSRWNDLPIRIQVTWNEYRVWAKTDHDRFVHVIESEAVRIAEILMRKRWSIVFQKWMMHSSHPIGQWVLQHQRERCLVWYRTQ